MYMSYSNPPFARNPSFELIPRQDDVAEPVFKLYHYDPTTAGAVIFVLLFLGTTCFHSYQLWRARTWFTIPLVLGGVCESHHEDLCGAGCEVRRTSRRYHSKDKSMPTRYAFDLY